MPRKSKVTFVVNGEEGTTQDVEVSVKSSPIELLNVTGNEDINKIVGKINEIIARTV